MKRYLEEIEQALKTYNPEKPLFLYSRKSFECNNSSKKIKDEIIRNLITEFGGRVICLEITGATEINCEDFYIKKEDMMDLERSKNAIYKGIVYYEIFEDEIFVNTLYEIRDETGLQTPLEVEYEATIENLLAFISRAREGDLKNLLDFIKKDRASKAKNKMY
ncbi:MAG: hypothetical protein QXL09_02200 [Candidatus Aenigmatarchaeota archaeon]